VLIVVTLSARLPGLLSAAGWRALSAGPVFVAEEAVAAAYGITATTVDGPDEFLAAARELPTAVFLGGDQEFVRALGGAVDVVTGAVNPPLLEMAEIMDRLRRECPWDSQQTHESLKSYLLEEAYETYDALEDGDPVALREELGDVLFQVFFHARLAEESAEPWGIDEVAGDLVAKLVRRHPHVFDGLAVSGADEVNANWDLIKRAEKQRDSIFDGVPVSLPALVLAETLRRKALRAHLPTEFVPAEFAIAEGDTESALRKTAREFIDRVRTAEKSARAVGHSTMDSESWRRFWPDQNVIT
jgi:XTP/dITP diphosphohydrolase